MFRRILLFQFHCPEPFTLHHCAAPVLCLAVLLEPPPGRAITEPPPGRASLLLGELSLSLGFLIPFIVSNSIPVPVPPSLQSPEDTLSAGMKGLLDHHHILQTSRFSTNEGLLKILTLQDLSLSWIPVRYCCGL